MRRWVDENLEPHEDFIGLYKVDSTAADVIVKVLKDTLLRFNLSIAVGNVTMVLAV